MSMPAHILIVEDNEMSLALAEYLLRQSGYSIASAADGATGVHLALENTAHLILCDLDLPVLDGPQLVSALRAERAWRKVPILAFTAASPSDIQRRTLADFDGCVAKPIDPASFAATVGEYLAPELRACNR
ncbi:response regulator [Steroidobacter sp.]|uniref:response regulator n=1 Tax=Steroidobacter sp. TaxID=1978227 RepID=UPI001A4EA62C|nr:response regulator [Steroidobacter sp.]MBL8266185.1 response regulator [Steroidobacter sp.]